jgi:tetratricopeptide (TPR) repeat protein
MMAAQSWRHNAAIWPAQGTDSAALSTALADGHRPQDGEGHERNLRQLLGLGEQALFTEGNLIRSRGRFDLAYHLAEKLGDHESMALAALGVCGLRVHEHRGISASALTQRRLRHALSALDPGSPLALRLRARIAAELDYRACQHERILRALREARRRQDSVAIAESASLAHHCVLGPDHSDLRLALADELIDEAARTGRPIDAALGVFWRAVDMLLGGDPQAGRCLAELRLMLGQSEGHALSYLVQTIDVMLAIRAGRLAEAEAAAHRCASAGRLVGDADADGYLAAQIICIRLHQGRIAELAPSLRDTADSPTLGVVDNLLGAASAVAAAAAGENHHATSALAQLDMATLPRSSTWLATMFGVAEAGLLVGDRSVLASVYELLLPVADLPAVVSLGAACFGSTHQSVGVACLGMGLLDKAIEHFRAAVRSNQTLRHWPATTVSRMRLAEALERRNAPGDRADAREEWQRALADARSLGIKAPIRTSARTVVAVGRRGRLHIACVRDGKHWRVRWGDLEARVAHSVGMGYLATLLSNPGYEVAALELATGSGLSAQLAPASEYPLIDDTARRAYRARLRELQSDIDEYEEMNDSFRVERLRVEYDWLVAELTAASGLSGRTRHFASSEERARISVGKAIRRAIGNIAKSQPELGVELEATIHTGLKCTYQPR